jgi:hypothetical protein
MGCGLKCQYVSSDPQEVPSFLLGHLGPSLWEELMLLP